MRRLATGWAKAAGPQTGGRWRERPASRPCWRWLIPDRIAKARGAPGQFLLANGRGAKLDTTDALAKAPYLVVAELQGAAAATRILLAARADEEEILAHRG